MTETIADAMDDCIHTYILTYVNIKCIPARIHIEIRIYIRNLHLYTYTGTYTSEDKWDVVVKGASGVVLEVTVRLDSFI